MQYFKNYKTIEEVKSAFRKLAFEFHPDKGGDVAIMQAINKEYAFAIAKLAKGQNLSEQDTENVILESEAYQNAINAISHLENIDIELVGAWVWVTGDTRPVKDTLKGAGFMFAPKKVAWYFRTAEFKSRRKSGLDLDAIRSKYGSESIKKNKRSYIS